MNAKFLVVGAILGGIVLFLWGGLTHAALPQPIREFKDPQAVVQAIRANTTGNAVYFARQGVFASVAFLPDFGDKTTNLTPNLVIQFITDTIAAFFLCPVVAGTRAGSPLGRAGRFTVIALAIVALKVAPYWNWYGFSTAFICMEVLDIVGKFFIAGLLLGWLSKKMVPA